VGEDAPVNVVVEALPAVNVPEFVKSVPDIPLIVKVELLILRTHELPMLTIAAESA
jgi:hypothetical protein